MKIIPGFVLFVTILAISVQAAQADPIAWTLQGVTIDDSRPITGSFTYDAVTNTYSNWSIFVAGSGDRTFPPYTYSPTSPGGGGILFGSANLVQFIGFPVDTSVVTRDLLLRFLSPLTDAGGTIGLGGSEHSCVFSIIFPGICFDVFRDITAGSVTAPAAVPEPSTSVLLASGIPVLLAKKWIRRGIRSWLPASKRLVISTELL